MLEGLDVGSILRALEEELLDQDDRPTTRQIAALLSDGFVGHGTTGRIYNKAQTLRNHSTRRHRMIVETRLEDFRVQILAERVALVTYRAVRRGIRANSSLRCSVWAYVDERWQLIFHQRTRTSTAAPAKQNAAGERRAKVARTTEEIKEAGTRQEHLGRRSTDQKQSKIVASVGAFLTQDTGAEQRRLIDGFRRDFIACLVCFREWLVTEGSPERSPAAVADVDDADRYEIAATCGHIGNIAHVALTLRETVTRAYIWSERFEFGFDAWPEAQHRIVRRLAMTLNLRLSAERLERLAGEADDTLRAYDRWLRGQAMIARFDPDLWSRAGKLFTGAADDPPSSLSLSSLVEMNNSVHIAHPGVLRDRALTFQTMGLAQRAVAIDPAFSRAQLCLGWSYAMAKRFEQAAQHMRLASVLNPNESWTLMSTALFSAFTGESARALDLADQSLTMSHIPSQTHWAYQVSILFLAEDYQGTIEAADQAEDFIRALPAWRAAALYYLGHIEEARLEAARFLQAIRARWFGDLPPSDTAIGYWLLHLYPIRDPLHWERLRAGVVGAGIPDAGIRHNAW